MLPANLKALSRFSDGLSYLYVEHAVIEKQDESIALYQEHGATTVPAASLGVIVLGPGTRITHAAVRALADCGASILWAGEEHTKLYAAGVGKTRSSANILRQARAWSDEKQRLRVVKRLYQYRFPEPLKESLTLQQIRGREGARVRDAYAGASAEFGVEWKGRSYKRGEWKNMDPVNRALSAGATCLYGVCHAAIVSCGFSTAIGFIHVGKQLSFVYDVADLYKIEVLIPAAFRAALEDPANSEKAVRTHLRTEIADSKLLKRVVRDLIQLFDFVDDPVISELDASNSETGQLWAPDSILSGGTNYASDDT